MKIRITLIAENNKPVSSLGKNPEKVIEKAWNKMLIMLGAQGDNKDKGYVEAVEIVEEGEE